MHRIHAHKIVTTAWEFDKIYGQFYALMLKRMFFAVFISCATQLLFFSTNEQKKTAK